MSEMNASHLARIPNSLSILFDRDLKRPFATCAGTGRLCQSGYELRVEWFEKAPIVARASAIPGCRSMPAGTMGLIPGPKVKPLRSPPLK